jgi:hypothetical protein
MEKNPLLSVPSISPSPGAESWVLGTEADRQAVALAAQDHRRAHVVVDRLTRDVEGKHVARVPYPRFR